MAPVDSIKSPDSTETEKKRASRTRAIKLERELTKPIDLA